MKKDKWMLICDLCMMGGFILGLINVGEILGMAKIFALMVSYYFLRQLTGKYFEQA